MDKQFLLNSLVLQVENSSEFIGKQDFLTRVSEFYDANKDIPNDEFFSKFNSQFPEVKVFNEAFERHSLKIIATNTSIIKIVLVIYFIVSFITTIFIVGYFSHHLVVH